MCAVELHLLHMFLLIQLPFYLISNTQGSISFIFHQTIPFKQLKFNEQLL